MNGTYSIPIHRRGRAASEQLELFNRQAGEAPPDELSQFVFDEENAVLQHALQAVLQRRFTDSPLVIYGDRGTGKSVLSLALLTQWRQQHSQLQSLRTTAVDFAREHARAVYSHALPGFRKKYFALDLLVLDDIQVLKTRSSAQQALCLMLDTFLEQDRILVVCCDRLPITSSGFDARLISRLMGGLQIKLSPPGQDAREVIVGRLSAIHGVSLDDATRKSLVVGTGHSGAGMKTVPEIRSALLRLRSQAELTSRNISQQDVEQLITNNEDSLSPTLRDIAAAVGKSLNIRLSDLKSKSRRRYVVRARGIAIYLCRIYTNKSYSEIGHYFGRRDHSTIMHAFKKTETSLSTDHSVQLVVEEAKARLTLHYRL